jgi:hypothetical protein
VEVGMADGRALLKEGEVQNIHNVLFAFKPTEEFHANSKRTAHRTTFFVIGIHPINTQN